MAGQSLEFRKNMVSHRIIRSMVTTELNPALKRICNISDQRKVSIITMVKMWTKVNTEIYAMYGIKPIVSLEGISKAES